MCGSLLELAYTGLQKPKASYQTFISILYTHTHTHTHTHTDIDIDIDTYTHTHAHTKPF